MHYCKPSIMHAFGIGAVSMKLLALSSGFTISNIANYQPKTVFMNKVGPEFCFRRPYVIYLILISFKGLAIQETTLGFIHWYVAGYLIELSMRNEDILF